MMKSKLSIEQFADALTTLRSMRLNASPRLFDEIFGEEMGGLYWQDFTGRYKSDLLAFLGYLDGAYREVLLKYLTSDGNKQTERKP